MCSSISQPIPQTTQSPCIFTLVGLACTTRCTDSASFEELVKSIWGLKLTFHVEAHKKYTKSCVSCTWRKFWIAENFKLFRKRHTWNPCRRWIIRWCMVAYWASSSVDCQFSSRSNTGSWWWIAWIDFLIVYADSIALQMLQHNFYMIENPQQIESLLVKV